MPIHKPLSRDESLSRRHEVARKAAAGELRLPGAIREMRLALGLTQKDFARYFHLTRSRVIALEAGRSNPTLETLSRIAKPFGFTTGFVPREKPEQRKEDL